MTVRKYLPWLRGLVSIATLVLLLSIYDIRQVFHLVTEIHAAALAVAVFAFVVTTLLFIAKWKLTLPESVDLMATSRGYVTSYFYSLLPTGQMGAELGKVMTLANHAELRRLAGSVVFDKITGLLALCLLGVLGWCFTAGAAIWMIVLVLCVIIACILALGCSRFASDFVPKLQRRTPNPLATLLTKLASASQPIASWVASPALLVKVLALGIFGQACMVAIYVIVAGALGIHLAMSQLALLVVIANLATVVPVSLGGVGVREASLVGMLAEQHVRGESAIALSLTVFAIFLLGAAIGAIVEVHDLLRAWKRHITRPGRNDVSRVRRGDDR